MATGATGQLGLALPVQGELSGTWGDTVNNGITQYTNIAIAATLTLTGDGAVTLANTTGDASASNITSSLTGAGTVTAQFAIVRVTGTLTTAKVVTAPSYSKTYTVVNAATGGIVTFKASGQTGISIAVGESAFVYYNGTDYVKVSGTASGAAGGSNTQVQYNSSGALAGSSGLTFDGTDFVLASGGLLDIDGTNAAVAMRIRQTTAGTGTEFTTTITENTGVTFNSSDSGGATARSFIWTAASTEGMRLTSTGLGVGTNAPTTTIQANIASATAYTTSSDGNIFTVQNSTASGYAGIRFLSEPASGNSGIAAINSFAPATGDAILAFSTRQAATLGERFRIGPSGQLGIGGANYGTAGQVLTSAGSGSAPTWATASGGSTSIGLVRAIAINCILC
jgi:hypothetical protein